MPHVQTLRVEFRQRCKTRVLAAALQAMPHQRSLDPFVSRLRQENQVGVLVLIDNQTGVVVAKRTVN